MEDTSIVTKGIGVLLLLLVAMTACDEFLVVGDARVGLRLNPEGSPEILYVACEEEEVARITMSLVEGTLGGDDDRVLWQVDASPPWSDGTLIEVVPGSTLPSGFSSTIPLQENVPSDLEITVAVWAAPDGFANASSFKINQLRPDQIFTDQGNQITMEEFRRIAADSCDGDL
jgi:hypothetical protein